MLTDTGVKILASVLFVLGCALYILSFSDIPADDRSQVHQIVNLTTLADRPFGSTTNVSVNTTVASEPPTLSVGLDSSPTTEPRLHSHVYLTLSDFTNAEPESSHLRQNLALCKEVLLFMPSVLFIGNDIFIVARVMLDTPARQNVCPSPRLRQQPVECLSDLPWLIYLSYVALFPVNLQLEPLRTVSGRFPQLSLNENGWDWLQLATTERGNQFAGYEDPRVFYWPTEAHPGRAFLIFNRFYQASGYSTRLMMIKQIVPHEAEGHYLLPAVPSTSGWERITQKNWSPIMPVAESDEFLFSQSVEPHVIQACTMLGKCRVFAESSMPILLSADHTADAHLHLGTNAVRLPTGDLLAAYHWKHGLYGFQNHFYIVEAVYPHRIKAISSVPITPMHTDLIPRNVEYFFYAASIAVIRDQYVLGGHVSDRVLVFMPLNIAEIMRSMKYI